MSKSRFMRDLLRTVQGRLAALGYYHLIVDGVPGPGTSNAVVRFKTAHGLRARDKIGPLTLRLLMSPDAKPAPRPVKVKGEPPWLVHARTLLGTREAPGAADNDVIMAWAQGLDQWYPGDDVPWCGLFVAECMAAGAPDEPQDFNRLGARQWLNYGAECDLSLGAVCVLWRGRRDGWKGHVFLVTGQSVDAVRGVGGNQSDAVTETWFSKERVLGYRKPDGAVLNPAPMAQRGVLSTNEA